MNSELGWENHIQECQQFDCDNFCYMGSSYSEKYLNKYFQVLEDMEEAKNKGVKGEVFMKIVKNAEWDLTRPKSQFKTLLDKGKIKTAKGEVSLKSIEIACGENTVTEEQIRIVLTIMHKSMNE